jgi:ABC-type polar amino acid transport system ATPase subunit
MLRAIGISKKFHTQRGLEAVDLELAEGSITAIIGPSGAGKSTLLRALSFLEPPDTGEMEIDGRQYRFPLAQESDEVPWPKVGVVFQELYLWPHLTLRQNIELPLKLRRIGDYEDRVNNLIDTFDLRDAVDRYPNETSLGQRQRAALIRALVLEPHYLLLDEITSALDVEHIGKVLRQLQESRAYGMGILLVTHLIGFARKSADKIIFLEDGKIIEAGTSEILTSPKTERLSRFLSLVEVAG